MSEDEGRTRNISSTDEDYIGGRIALNFINTLRAEAGVPVDTLQADKDVRIWMRKMGLEEPACLRPWPEGALLRSTRALRRVALLAVEQKKAGKRVNLAGLNHYLSQAASSIRLVRRGDEVEARREYISRSAEQFLAPVAEAIGDLLASSDFDLIWQCEGSGCVLWFADRANGRRRRFCTEASCGTRMRVAAYRRRLALRPQLVAKESRGRQVSN